MNSFLLTGSMNYKRVREFYEFLTEAEGTADPLIVEICSHGGDESCGRAIAGMIKKIQAGGVKVVTVGYGNIHSAAVIVLAAGDSRFLSHAANVMVHESSTESHRNASGFKKLSKQMEADESFWCKLLEDYTGTEAKVWAKLHADETYLTPQQCLDLKLATELI